MNTFTTTPLSVKSVKVDGYTPKKSTATHPATVAEIVANSPSLIWGPVPSKRVPEKMDTLSTKPVRKETIVDKLLKFASRHAPEVVEVMMRDHKK